jgi:Fe-coproporphyrin III synthase
MNAKEPMDKKYYNNLPNFSTINITGGEPFLRDEIEDIIEILRKKSKRIIISTNGLLSTRILRVAKKYPWLGFRFSLDGIGVKNDKMRGIPGAFDRIVELIKDLKAIGVKDMGICATFGYGNEDQVMPLHNLAKRLDVQFLMIVRHDSFYYNKKNKPFDVKLLEKNLNELIKKGYFRTFDLKNYGRAYYTHGSIEFAKGNKRLMGCDAGWTSFYLDPYGEIFPCVILGKSLGNIRKDRIGDVRRKINCSLNCWMPCTVNQQIRSNPLPAMGWLIRSKFLQKKK